MCVKCSRCETTWYCKSNTIMKMDGIFHPVPGLDCPINFYYVSGCQECLKWIRPGWMKFQSIGLNLSIQSVLIHSVMSAICMEKSNGNEKKSTQPSWLMLLGLHFLINQGGFGYVLTVGMVMNNENQQNLLHSDRIGSGIEEKTQPIRDSYQSVEKISWSRWIIICFRCNNTTVNGCSYIKNRYRCYFEEITSSYPCEVITSLTFCAQVAQQNGNHSSSICQTWVWISLKPSWNWLCIDVDMPSNDA